MPPVAPAFVFLAFQDNSNEGSYLLSSSLIADHSDYGPAEISQSEKSVFLPGSPDFVELLGGKCREAEPE